MTTEQIELDIIKRLQNGALELLAIELRDTEERDTVTRTEVLDDLKHRLGYVMNQVDKLIERNEGMK